MKHLKKKNNSIIQNLQNFDWIVTKIFWQISFKNTKLILITYSLKDFMILLILIEIF